MRSILMALMITVVSISLMGCAEKPVSTNKSLETVTKEGKGKSMNADIPIK